MDEPIGADASPVPVIGAVAPRTMSIVTRRKRGFPSDICATLESALSARPSGPNEFGVLDDDWAFVSCLASDDYDEVVVTLRAANNFTHRATQPPEDPYIDYDTRVVIAADDLDVVNGRSLGVNIGDLAPGQFLVFSRPAAPDEVSGIIRLPGWDPGF